MNKFNKIAEIRDVTNGNKPIYFYEGFTDAENKKLWDVLNIKKSLTPGDITESDLVELMEIENVLDADDELEFKKISEKYGNTDILYFIENRLAGYGKEKSIIQAQKANYFLEKQGINIAQKSAKLYKNLMDGVILSIVGEGTYFLKNIYKYLSDEDYKYIISDMYNTDDDGSWYFDSIYQESAYKMLFYLKNDYQKILSPEIYQILWNSYLSQYNHITENGKYYEYFGYEHLKQMENIQKDFLNQDVDKSLWLENEKKKYDDI